MTAHLTLQTPPSLSPRKEISPSPDSIFTKIIKAIKKLVQFLFCCTRGEEVKEVEKPQRKFVPRAQSSRLSPLEHALLCRSGFDSNC